MDGSVSSITPPWIVLVPVQDPTRAKSRLASLPRRAQLALAMAQDTIAAVQASPMVRGVYVMTPDIGDVVDIPSVDHVLDPPGRGLNASLAHAANDIADREAPHALAIVLADLPCLRPSDFTSILADLRTRSMLSDATGTGTTMWLDPAIVSRRADLAGSLHFGLHSCAAHVAAGARNIADTLPMAVRIRAQRDVDTAVDLWDATRIGVGPHTRNWGAHEAELAPAR